MLNFHQAESVCVYVSVCLYMDIYTHKAICMYICVCTYVCIYIYTYMYEKNTKLLGVCIYKSFISFIYECVVCVYVYICIPIRALWLFSFVCVAGSRLKQHFCEIYSFSLVKSRLYFDGFILDGF